MAARTSLPANAKYLETLRSVLSGARKGKGALVHALDILGNSMVKVRGIDAGEPQRQALEAVDHDAKILLLRLVYGLLAETHGLTYEIPARRGESQQVDDAPSQTVRRVFNRARELGPGDVKQLNVEHTALCVGSIFKAMHVRHKDIDMFLPVRDEITLTSSSYDACWSQILYYLATMRTGERGHGELELVQFSVLRPRDLGTLYETLMEVHFDPELPSRGVGGGGGGGGTAGSVNPRAKRFKLGAFYTSDVVVSYLVKHALGPLVDQRLAADGSPEELLESLCKLRVLDPACGAGHFLVAAVQYIATRFESYMAPLVSGKERKAEEGALDSCKAVEDGWRPSSREKILRLEGPAMLRERILRCCIYGVDMDPTAANLTKMSLMLYIAACGQKGSRCVDQHMKLNVVVGNSLFGLVHHGGATRGLEPRLDLGQPCFHWALQFPQCVVKGGGFDCILANPPFRVINTKVRLSCNGGLFVRRFQPPNPRRILSPRFYMALVSINTRSGRGRICVTYSSSVSWNCCVLADARDMCAGRHSTTRVASMFKSYGSTCLRLQPWTALHISAGTHCSPQLARTCC